MIKLNIYYITYSNNTLSVSETNMSDVNLAVWPIRCYTCNRVIARYQIQYEDKLDEYVQNKDQFTNEYWQLNNELENNKEYLTSAKMYVSNSDASPEDIKIVLSEMKEVENENKRISLQMEELMKKIHRPIEAVLDELGIHRECCRTRIITVPVITDVDRKYGLSDEEASIYGRNSTIVISSETSIKDSIPTKDIENYLTREQKMSLPERVNLEVVPLGKPNPPGSIPLTRTVRQPEIQSPNIYTQRYVSIPSSRSNVVPEFNIPSERSQYKPPLQTRAKPLPQIERARMPKVTALATRTYTAR